MWLWKAIMLHFRVLNNSTSHTKHLNWKNDENVYADVVKLLLVTYNCKQCNTTPIWTQKCDRQERASYRTLTVRHLATQTAQFHAHTDASTKWYPWTNCTSLFSLTQTAAARHEIQQKHIVVMVTGRAVCLLREVNDGCMTSHQPVRY